MKVNKVNTVVTKIIKLSKKNIKETTPKLKAKKYPNWVGLPNEKYGGKTVLCDIIFAPEDVEKMKAMTKEEASWYRARLFKENRYSEKERTIVMSEELAAILGDLSQYEVK